MLGPMLRSLLEERFNLQLHREIEQVPMYRMVVASSGLKIAPLAEGACVPGEPGKPSLFRPGEAPAVKAGEKPVCGHSTAGVVGKNRVLDLGGVPLATLAKLLGLDRRVLDETGVGGLFNIHLEYSTESADEVFSALAQQIGLKIESTKGPRGVVVIDRAERPTPNLPV
jgi:uncharacterized protein (TIGR03435 family)